MDTLTDSFVKGALALAPVTATQAGYHTHTGAALDEQIDDFSAAGIDAQRQFYLDMQRQVSALETAALGSHARRMTATSPSSIAHCAPQRRPR